MKETDISKLQENFIGDISAEWMLIAAGDASKFNAMTANWGFMGYVWNKPSAIVFVRPERHTFGFIEERECFTLSFLGAEHKAAHKVFGTKSGRNIDKVKETRLSPAFTALGNPYFAEARLVLECKKTYSEMLKPDCFTDKDALKAFYGAKGNPHKFYFAEILSAWQK